MSIGKRVGGALLAASLVGSLLSGVPASGASAAVAAPVGAAGEDGSNVTLITGDQLIVQDSGEVILEPDPARRDIGSTQFSNRGHEYVVPADALPAIAAGELDLQLFSVTELLEPGFAAGELPLVVTYAGGRQPDTRALLSAGGAAVTRDLPSADSVAASASAASLGQLWTELTVEVPGGRRLKSGVDKVWLDQILHTSLDQSVAQVGAPAAHAAGFDGTGVTVAVLDSGIDTDHPDLAGKVVAEQNFTSEPDASDLGGHGTHVASTIAGSGAASGGSFQGVAPGATLLNGKVCVESGGCAMSAIIDGMEWATAQGADVVNMSLGGPDTPEADPLEQAVNDLTASTDTLFVVAAGNIPQTPSLAAPGTAEAALTVGAVDGDDNLAEFSHVGPVPGDAALKPDLTAPGVEITAAAAGTQGYREESGTSMATPHVAGAAAILQQRHPTWSAMQLKSALVGSTEPNASLSSYQQGSGRLDVARAYQQEVLAEPASISLGRQEFPHDDDPVLTRTVTYTNHGAGAVTLDLALETRGPSGDPAPAGMFVLSDTSVTVPAGGTATATLTTDTSVDTPNGFYTGAVVATATDIQVRTAFAVDRAIEAYDLTLDHINRQGDSTASYVTLVQPVDGSDLDIIAGPGPVTVPRLPRGDYQVVTRLLDFGPQGQEVSVLTVPRLELTGDRSVVMDAQLAEPVSISIADDPDVAVDAVTAGVQATEGAWLRARAANGNPMYTAQIGDQSAWGSVSEITATLAMPDDNFWNSPRVYHLAWYKEHQLPTGWTRVVAPEDLTAVEATFAGHIPGSFATKAAYPHPSGVLFGEFVGDALGEGLHFDLPFQRTEYYLTGDGVRWHSVMAERVDPTGPVSHRLVSPVTEYTAGTTVQETWNRPVYGPAFTSPIYPQNWVVRRGDTIIADVPLTGDGDGHAGLPHPSTVTGTLVLERDGTVIGESPFPKPGNPPEFPVPTGYAQYRLEATVDRQAPVALSTQVSAAWTFQSDTGDPNAYLRLPLWAVTFSPDTDLQGTAPSGGSFEIPLRAHVQPDSPASGLRTLSIEYSLDDGDTWQSAPVTVSADGTGSATVMHPSGTGFVSLRALAKDWAGNTVEQTVIRAYRIAPA